MNEFVRAIQQTMTAIVAERQEQESRRIAESFAIAERERAVLLDELREFTGWSRSADGIDRPFAFIDFIVYKEMESEVIRFSLTRYSGSPEIIANDPGVVYELAQFALGKVEHASPLRWHKVRELANFDCPPLPSRDTVCQLIAEHLLDNGRTLEPTAPSTLS